YHCRKTHIERGYRRRHPRPRPALATLLVLERPPFGLRLFKPFLHHVTAVRAIELPGVRIFSQRSLAATRTLVRAALSPLQPGRVQSIRHYLLSHTLLPSLYLNLVGRRPIIWGETGIIAKFRK